MLSALIIVLFVIPIILLEMLRRELRRANGEFGKLKESWTQVAKEIDGMGIRLTLIETVISQNDELRERYARLCTPSRFEPTQ